MNDSTLPAAEVTGSWTPDGEKIAPPSEVAVLDAICTVFDPEIPVNIYELGLIYAVDIGEQGDIKVEMTLTAPACPSAQELPEMVRDAVRRMREQDDHHGRLLAALEIGERDIAAGRTVPYTPDLLQQIEQEARTHAANKLPTNPDVIP